MANLINLSLEPDSDEIQEGVPIKTANFYHQRPITLPEDFLRGSPPDGKPTTIRRINWAETSIPEFEGRYACVVDNVISPSECEALLKLAEESVADESRGRDGNTTWRPALVNVGGGLEVLDSGYRNSDRIIWDHQEVVDRLWERMKTAVGLAADLEKVPFSGTGWDVTWKFSRLNQRMRFLKYQGGQFFLPHCDSSYNEVKDGKEYCTFYTVHLYLNDSVVEAEPEDKDKTELVGGATSFLSFDEKRKVDVNPKAGRVLIFGHRGLFHSGDDVVKGTKYTVRTDILYEKVP